MTNQTITYSSPNLTNANESAANTETIVGTLAGVLTRFPGQVIRVRADIFATPGATVTNVALRIRRFTLTGTQVGSTVNTSQPTASKINPFAIIVEDSPGEGSFTYVVTFQGTGEGGAASFQSCELTADVN